MLGRGGRREGSAAALAAPEGGQWPPPLQASEALCPQPSGPCLGALAQQGQGGRQPRGSQEGAPSSDVTAGLLAESLDGGGGAPKHTSGSRVQDPRPGGRPQSCCCCCSPPGARLAERLARLHRVALSETDGQFGTDGTSKSPQAPPPPLTLTLTASRRPARPPPPPPPPELLSCSRLCPQALPRSGPAPAPPELLCARLDAGPGRGCWAHCSLRCPAGPRPRQAPLNGAAKEQAAARPRPAPATHAEGAAALTGSQPPALLPRSAPPRRPPPPGRKGAFRSAAFRSRSPWGRAGRAG